MTAWSRLNDRNGPSGRPGRHAVRARQRLLGGVAGTALAGVLAGCGIAPTDVIDAGEPAMGVRSPGQPVADVQLFFYGPSGLRSAIRPAKAPVDPEQAIELLLEGPNHAERMRGLTSALSKFPSRPVVTTGEGTVMISVPPKYGPPDSASLNQLVCTAANARVPGGKPPERVAVTLVGQAFRLNPMVCGGNNAFPVVQPSPSDAADGGDGASSGGDASGTGTGTGTTEVGGVR
ncbi:lipoprotein [Streptomyces sp. NBRC 110611]|uniref:GerMN domain-containing protein n=1 Tax=Streptomyces sp. NBRC 110611 TaxID=1621259 RepID=UPI00082B3949|nr:GerMN domain-containing protein [Streptomyces sp. NBRC 110611]GAU65685.1 lipoprotein [Streptomyces sp. NBRC 110611]